MSKNKRKQPQRSTPLKVRKKSDSTLLSKPLLLALGGCVITAIAFFPMLSNGFTNWDDQFYITDNTLLRGPDWAGIFSKPLMANYHPLTVASLALNYQLSALAPFSYHLVNWLIHILNVGLVFFLAFRLSGNKPWVGVITALVFGVHPMHVESVAWASERKDVLYTAFFVLSLLCYLKYIQQPDWKKYSGTLALFVLSLLSKPAVVILPVVLLTFDWYKGRSFKNSKVWIEKIPFFMLSLIFGLLTIKYQESSQAFVESDSFPFWQKIVFSFYGFGEYVKRLFWPFPMSAIHPFPSSGIIPGSYYLSLIIALAVIMAAWYFRKKQYVVVGVGFYAINIALVLQLLTFGHSIISERYTYVPYIGLAFVLAMAWDESTWSATLKKGILCFILLACLGFAAISFQQVQVWNNGFTLWSNAIETYPNSYIARSSRGQYLAAKQGKYDDALVDYAVALQVQPNDSFSLINRASIYINQQNFPAAFADGDSLIKHAPWIAKGHLFRGIASDQLGNSDQAYDDYTNCIRRDSFIAEAWSSRAVLLYNKKQNFSAAKADFDRAIMLDPGKGINYKNRARCWIKFGNRTEALKDLESAKRQGVEVGEDLMQAAQSLP